MRFASWLPVNREEQPVLVVLNFQRTNKRKHKSMTPQELAKRTRAVYRTAIFVNRKRRDHLMARIALEYHLVATELRWPGSRSVIEKRIAIKAEEMAGQKICADCGRPWKPDSARRSAKYCDDCRDRKSAAIIAGRKFRRGGHGPRIK